MRNSQKLGHRMQFGGAVTADPVRRRQAWIQERRGNDLGYDSPRVRNQPGPLPS
jgi:hypothetical protein